MLTVINTGEERTFLRNISWQLYESLLTEIGDDGKARLSYYQGNLEFMSPLFEHEHSNISHRRNNRSRLCSLRLDDD
jgi:Uma2 family endonuclease